MYLHSKTKLPPPGCLPFTAKQTIKSAEVGEEKQQKCKKVSLFSLTKQNRTPGRSSVLGPAVSTTHVAALSEALVWDNCLLCSLTVFDQWNACGIVSTKFNKNMRIYLIYKTDDFMAINVKHPLNSLYRIHIF